MAINVSVQQYNDVFLPDTTILLTLSYYHRGIRLNHIKSFFDLALQTFPLAGWMLQYIDYYIDINTRFRCTSSEFSYKNAHLPGPCNGVS